MSYDGYLAPYKQEIIAAFNGGRTFNEIADDLERRGIKTRSTPWDKGGHIRYILQREGIIKKVEHPEPEPQDVPDDMPLLDWLARENESDWPKGLLTRVRNIFEIMAAEYPTVGHIRKAPDAELLRLPNFGGNAFRQLRGRLRRGGTIQPEPQQPPRENLRLEVERLRGENQALRYALELLTNKVLPRSPGPVSTENDEKRRQD